MTPLLFKGRESPRVEVPAFLHPGHLWRRLHDDLGLRDNDPHPGPVQALFAFHQDPSNLHRIQPPGVRVMEVVLPPEWCVGARLSVRVRILGLVPQAWEVRLEEVSPPTRLVDVAIRGPYPVWRHVHAFREDGPGHSTLTDRVEYQPPWGRLGVLLDRVFFRPQLAVMFAWRHRQTRRLLESMPERCVERGGTGPGSASSTFQGP